MRKLLPLLLMFPVLAAAQADRFVVEDGTTGSVTVSANPTLLFGQEATTLVAHTCAANACTRTAPTTSTVQGLKMGGVAAYRVEACVSTGTLSGTGNIELYVLDPNTASATKWSYLLGADLSLVGAVGQVCASWPTLISTFRGNGYRLVARSNAVATSAAAPTLTVSIRACLKSGCAL